MKKTLPAALVAGALIPAAAMAEVKFSAESYLGYTSAEDVDPWLAEAKARVDGTHVLDNGIKLNFSAAVNLRSNQDDLLYIDDNIVDAELGFDMGTAGKLTFSTFVPHNQKPWADGKIRRRGSANVWPDVSSYFIPVVHRHTIFYQGRPYKAERNFYIQYDNKIGNLGVEIVADPFNWVGPVYGSDVEAPVKVPQIQGKLSYKTGFGTYSFAVSDRKDYELAVVYPVADTGLTLGAAYSVLENDSDMNRSEILATYRTDNMGIFKGFFAIYNWAAEGNLALADNENWVISTNWGADKWNARLGVDSDGDMAAEFGYKIARNVEFLAAWDNGFDAGDGFDLDHVPPMGAPPRGSAFEVGLLFTM